MVPVMMMLMMDGREEEQEGGEEQMMTMGMIYLPDDSELHTHTHIRTLASCALVSRPCVRSIMTLVGRYGGDPNRSNQVSSIRSNDMLTRFSDSFNNSSNDMLMIFNNSSDDMLKSFNYSSNDTLKS